MATPADQRLLELLEKWLSSLDLHAKYASLDDDSYSRIQPWPEHQRPSRWIIDLAKQKALALRDQIRERVEMGDVKFSDSLELMTFLANLVGSQHIERFIPLADAESEASSSRDGPEERGAHARGAPAPSAVPARGAHAPGAVAAPSDTATATREMPKFLGGKPRAPAPPGTANVARTERRAPEIKAAAKTAKTPGKAAGANKAIPGAKAAAAPAATDSQSTGVERSGSSNVRGPSEAAREQVIADAARLVQWGRKWYELAELIASMADRPHLTDVRRILKDNKAIIDKKAGRA